MFNAMHFTYDGIYSGTYGLIIADISTENVTETTAFSPSLTTIKTPKAKRFIHCGVTYEEAPQFEFSIMSEQPISDLVRREILAWLIGRNQFKELTIHQPDLERYKYHCVFSQCSIIYINGMCHGFRLTATFDSWYQYGDPVTFSGSAGEGTFYIYNESDLVDEYVYPIITFKEGTGITLTNLTDNPSESFVLANLNVTETITVDNELKYISSDLGGSKLNNFTSKNWFKLRKGNNAISYTSDGDFTIICPTYIMIGF